MGRKKPHPGLGQEQLILEERAEPKARYVSTSYSQAEAERAAQTRKKRQGRYALNVSRCAGFIAASSGLFVPHSRAEMKAVVSGPVTDIHDTITKYRNSIVHWGKSEEEVTEACVTQRQQLWAQVGNFRRWQVDAYKHKGSLERGLNADRVPSLELITEDDICLSALTSYLVRLNAFAGRVVDEDGKPRWIQENWTRLKRQQEDYAHEYMTELNSSQIFSLHREALYSEWARGRYWSTQLYDVIESEKRYQITEPDYIQVPIQYYE